MNIKFKQVIFLIISVFFIKILPVYASIYMYIDKNGVYHFTNTPTSSKYKLYIKKDNSKVFKYYPNKFDHIIKEASNKHGIAFLLLKSIIKVESDFNPKAVSKKGAKGLMQIMPSNYKHLKIKDPFNPRENIMGGTSFFKNLLKRFNGDLQLSLAAYNAGPNLVERLNGIPPIKETENYIRKVMKYYYKFKKEKNK